MNNITATSVLMGTYVALTKNFTTHVFYRILKIRRKLRVR